MNLFNDHNYDKLLKRCPFCNGKATLRSPTRLRGSRCSILSDVSCTKCGILKASECFNKYDPKKDHEYNFRELPREIQDLDVIKKWNTRK